MKQNFLILTCVLFVNLQGAHWNPKAEEIAEQRIAAVQAQPVQQEVKQTNEEALFDAALNNNIEKVKNLLAMGSVDINWKNKAKQTPLIAASIRGNIEIAKVLLDSGADTRSTVLVKYEELGHTVEREHDAMFIASLNNHFKLVKLFIQYGIAIHHIIPNEIEEVEIGDTWVSGPKYKEYYGGRMENLLKCWQKYTLEYSQDKYDNNFSKFRSSKNYKNYAPNNMKFFNDYLILTLSKMAAEYLSGPTFEEWITVIYPEALQELKGVENLYYCSIQ